MKKTTSLFEIDNNAPVNNSEMFELINPVPLDPNKETMAIIIFNHFKQTYYDHIYGFTKEVIEVLKEQYNIVYIGKDIQKDCYKGMNVYRLNSSGYNSINANEFKRKKEDSNSTEYNHQILLREFERAFGKTKIDRVFYVTSEYFGLPFTTYYKGKYAELKNEFHDYVGNDPKEISEINKMVRDFSSKYNEKVSLLAFTMFTKNIFFNLTTWLHEKYDLKKVYTVNIDPVSFVKYFDYHKIPTSHFYFIDDKRGTRNYDEFPMAHVQHLLHENKHHYIDPNTIRSKTKEFFFMGSILQDKGGRKDLWYKYLQGFNHEDSTLWIPIKLNGVFIHKSKTTSRYGKEQIEKAKEKYSDLVEEITNHPSYDGHVYPDQIKGLIKDYKYSLVLRCVSFKDSLNFRPLFYTYMRRSFNKMTLYKNDALLH